MKTFLKLAGVLFILGASTLLSEEANAQSCTVSVRRDVNFGDYDPLIPGNLDTTGRIRVRCRQPNQIPFYTVKLGTGSGGSYTPRKMFSGPETLDYNLYLDSTHITIWGDGTSGTSFITVSPAVRNRIFTIYARTPLGQNASVGLYSDVVTVTVEF